LALNRGPELKTTTFAWAKLHFFLLLKYFPSIISQN
jgi:hypothetical protein